MKYIQYTYKDAETGISIDKSPHKNILALPNIEKLTFGFAVESEYPTNVPKFYGTVPYITNIQVEGVLKEVTESEYKLMQQKEALISARKSSFIGIQEFKDKLTELNLLNKIDEAVKNMNENTQLDWEATTTTIVGRSQPFILDIASKVGLTEEQLDDIFIKGLSNETNSMG